MLGEKYYFKAVAALYWALKGVEVPNHSKSGFWQEIFNQIKGDIDNECNFIDWTIVKKRKHSTWFNSDESE